MPARLHHPRRLRYWPVRIGSDMFARFRSHCLLLPLFSFSLFAGCLGQCLVAFGDFHKVHPAHLCWCFLRRSLALHHHHHCPWFCLVLWPCSTHSLRQSPDRRRPVVGVCSYCHCCRLPGRHSAREWRGPPMHLPPPPLPLHLLHRPCPHYLPPHPAAVAAAAAGVVVVVVVVVAAAAAPPLLLRPYSSSRHSHFVPTVSSSIGYSLVLIVLALVRCLCLHFLLLVPLGAVLGHVGGPWWWRPQAGQPR
mmetsp:Transcript_19594/g.42365  ORF Transcript_19594/g.42365 Transcript_19594/m.42365 type:complete len:249 (+) Transcript_19594:1103-1849(+)